MSPLASSSVFTGRPSGMSSQTLSGPERQVSLRDWIAVCGGMLGAFMAVLDIQITNASLKEIAGGLGASVDEGSWISTAYLIAEIVVIPLTAFFGPVFSLRRYLVANAALFLTFSVLCGMATSLPQMILFRAAQGFTGGVMIPTAFSIVFLKLLPAKRPVGAALFSLTATFAPAVGPTLGGWLTETLSWHWIFYVNIPPGLILIAAISHGLDPQPMQLGRLRGGDWFGIACMAVGLGCLEYVLEEGERKDWFGDPTIQTCAWLAGLFLIAFVAVELTRREPFINLRLLARRGLASACAVNFATGLALYGSVFVLPLYLGQVQGYNAQQIGELFMWMGLPQLAIIPFVPRIMRWVDPRLLIAFGVAVFAASCFMNTSMSAGTAGPQLRWAQMVRALGQPFILSPLASLATAGIAPAEAGSASALFNIMRNLGGSIGIAALSTLITMREQYHFSVIAERMTRNGLVTQERIAALAARFGTEGAGSEVARTRAIAAMGNWVRRDASVMAYADCYFVIGAALLLSLFAVVFLARPRSGPAGGGGH